MKKKIVFALCVVFLALLAVILGVSIKSSNSTGEELSGSLNQSDESSGDVSILTGEKLVSLVPLQNGENLIRILTMDFDGDGYDDQVNAIKKAASETISLLVGLYNPSKSMYERKTIIDTDITNARTFSYSGMDLTGEHRTVLVYQGFAKSGESELLAYMISNENNQFALKKIADFKSDGTIFINQGDDFGSTAARSNAFPIWVHCSDKDRGNSQDQIQICYEWNKNLQEYVETKRNRLKGSLIQAKELSRIQDGTVETFASFLDGLWYKNEHKKGIRYVFFDYGSKEIIFYKDDTEEVYQWAHSTLRSNGIYLSAVNQEIESLYRRIDVGLRNVDEVRIRIRDDVKMLITESTDWDGDYKKVSKSSLSVIQKKKTVSKGIDNPSETLEKQKIWATSDGTKIVFASNSFRVNSPAAYDSGVYTNVKIMNETFIQFKSNVLQEKSMFKGLFKPSIEEKKITGEKNFILTPFKAQPDGVYSLDQRSIVLVPVKTEELSE